MKTNNKQKRQVWLKGIVLFNLFTLLSFFVACDHIDESDRLIKVAEENNATTPPPSDEGVSGTAKNVLIEDFTGQRCSNCPNGTKVIEQLQETYGDDRVIAVGIHSGPFGKLANGNLLPLTTETGCEYYDQRGVESQPGAQIDRKGVVIYNVQEWIKAVKEDLGLLSEVKMEVEAKVNGENIDITLHEEAYGPFDGKLQVWILEDGITAQQIMPDGTTNRSYVHNHVFRTAVNGTWGEDFSINAKESKSQTLSQHIDTTWNTDNLSVVAFIYNGNGVEQAAMKKVKE